MVILRPAQIETFEAERMLRFEHDTVAHIRERLPQHYEALGEHGTLQTVREAITHATDRGLQTQVGVTVFVRLSFVFGLDFAERFSWAQQALADGSAAEHVRIERLSAGAMGHARALVSGQAPTTTPRN